MQRNEAPGESGCQWTIVDVDHEQPRDDVGEVTHVPETWKRYWDDKSGKEFKPELVHEA